MSKFKCKCLNVTIHVKEKGLREASGGAFVSDASASTFFAGEIYEVELAVGGITKEVGSLLQLSKVEDWDVFTCINCSIETHALHAVKKYDRVLVNKKMEGNPDVLNKRTSCPQYSRVFKIILDPLRENEQSALDNSSVAGKAVLLGKDNISLGMASVQEQARKFLETEEKAMAERIRKFVEEQRSEFAALQSQVYMDKQAVYWAIRKAEEKSMEQSLHEAIADASSDTLLLQRPQMTKYPANIVQGFQDQIVKQVHITQVAAQKNPFSRPDVHTSYSMRKVAQKPHYKNSREPLESDADPMFRLDDFTDDCEPFFESEEDDLSSDNSFQSEEPPYHTRFREIKNPSMEYSSSAPIRMPMGKNSPPDNDAKFAIPEPSKIRESMKAIARSLHDNSKEQFGELPRSRTTTYCYR